MEHRELKHFTLEGLVDHMIRMRDYSESQTDAVRRRVAYERYLAMKHAGREAFAKRYDVRKRKARVSLEEIACAQKGRRYRLTPGHGIFDDQEQFNLHRRRWCLVTRTRHRQELTHGTSKLPVRTTICSQKLHMV